jgi:hypothetical protein
MGVYFDAKSNIDHISSIHQILRKIVIKLSNKLVFYRLKNAYDSVSSDFFYNNLEFKISMKLLIKIKMLMNVSYISVRIEKNMPEVMFRIKNDFEH